jgi:hypothetical protein
VIVCFGIILETFFNVHQHAMSLGHTLFDESIYELLIGDRRWVENTEGLVGVEVLGGLGSEREGAWLVVSLMVGCCMIAW